MIVGLSAVLIIANQKGSNNFNLFVNTSASSLLGMYKILPTFCRKLLVDKDCFVKSRII